MEELFTYSLNDFFPLTPEVYGTLIVRLNEEVWPLHIVALSLGVAAMVAAVRNHMRPVLIILAGGSSVRSQASTPSMARLMMSAAVPCIGALIALRSAYWRRWPLRELISGR